MTSTSTDDMTFRDAPGAFENAIRAGILCDDPRSPVYAGKYMYMFTDPARGDAFKHVDTRHYIYVTITLGKED